jgi:hypothetical protein
MSTPDFQLPTPKPGKDRSPGNPLQVLAQPDDLPSCFDSEPTNIVLLSCPEFKNQTTAPGEPAWRVSKETPDDRKPVGTGEERRVWFERDNFSGKIRPFVIGYVGWIRHDQV